MPAAAPVRAILPTFTRAGADVSWPPLYTIVDVRNRKLGSKLLEPQLTFVHVPQSQRSSTLPLSLTHTLTTTANVTAHLTNAYATF